MNARQNIQSLVFMFSGAIFVAFLVVMGLVYYFGSSGTFLLKNILVSPDTLKKNAFFEEKEKKQGPSRYIFNQIEFVFGEKNARGWGRFTVSLESYKEFYRKVANLRSIPKISPVIITQFDQIYPSTLTIYALSKQNSDSEGIIFQQVQFMEGSDLFRVQYRETSAGMQPSQSWIYFQYPDIYKQAMDAFTPILEDPGNIRTS